MLKGVQEPVGDIHAQSAGTASYSRVDLSKVDIEFYESFVMDGIVSDLEGEQWRKGMEYGHGLCSLYEEIRQQLDLVRAARVDIVRRLAMSRGDRSLNLELV